MTSYEIVDTTLDQALTLAPRMRPEDAAEAWAGARLRPADAIRYSVLGTPRPMAGLIDGKVEFVFGVGLLSILGMAGAPWMLTGIGVTSHQIIPVLLLRSRKVVAEWFETYDQLENRVDARNVEAVRWLRWLGFEIDEPAPYGPDALPFCRFHWER